MSIAVSWNRTFSFISFNHFAKILTFAILLTAAAGASATSSLSQVSCSSNAYSGPATDACTVRLAAKASSRFYVSLTSNNPAVTVPNGVTVRSGAVSSGFKATVAGVTTAQTATITAQAGGTAKTFSIALSPAAVTPAVGLSATSLAFGNVSVGTAVTKSVTVTSSGNVAVTINSASISGTGFSILGGSFPVTLNPGQGTVLTVQFAPTSASSVTGQLTISSNAPAATLSLSGTGTGVTPTLSAFSCGSSSFTGAGTTTCTVSLSSAAPTGGVGVGLTSSSSAVTVPSSVTVPATATSATFTANVASVSTAQTVTLTASTGSTSLAASLQLNASTPALSLNATSISFGSVVVNTTASQTVTLTSTGTAAVTVNSATASGTGFSASGASLPATLNPGQSMTLEVQFDPATVGNFSGQLTVGSTASNNTVPLSGVGASHEVDLSWIAPSGSSDPVVGYNIYRAPSGTTTYQQVNTTVDTETVYTDSTVQSGLAYQYYVTSVDSSGVESSPSNTTTVTVP